MKAILTQVLIYAVCGLTMAVAQSEAPRTAVFINDLTGGQHADLEPLVGEILTAELTLMGFAIIPAEEVGAFTPDTAAGRLKLSSTMTATELAQSLEAEFLIVVNLITYGPQSLIYGQQPSMAPGTNYALWASYDLLAPSAGSPLSGDDIQLAETFAIEQTKDDAADLLAEEFAAELATIIAVSVQEQTGVTPPLVLNPLSESSTTDSNQASAEAY